ncbi:MAG: hypothetical protein C4581_13595 [Nitrospiraceae bacterium]|nr:MAG: hypothetical protein C4581_13595 [Nitrospiraceae bacterium]
MSKINRRYRVIIPYSEPTFVAHKGIQRKEPFRAEYFITAGSAKQAQKDAIIQFKQDTTHAHVGWVRIPDYNGIEVTVAPEKQIVSDQQEIYPGPDRREKN